MIGAVQSGGPDLKPVGTCNQTGNNASQFARCFPETLYFGTM